MSGVRASSIRIESTSSTIAYAWLRCDGAVERDGHVVAQIVEAELGVRPVRDVAGVGLAPLGERHHVLDGADGRAELLVHGARPLGVALREVVVDGDEVDASARERVQVERLHGDVNVFPSPVFCSAMSPSWSTIPPMSWTSKSRTPIVRLNASRTAA